MGVEAADPAFQIKAVAFAFMRQDEPDADLLIDPQSSGVRRDLEPFGVSVNEWIADIVQHQRRALFLHTRQKPAVFAGYRFLAAHGGLEKREHHRNAKS